MQCKIFLSIHALKLKTQSQSWKLIVEPVNFEEKLAEIFADPDSESDFHGFFPL